MDAKRNLGGTSDSLRSRRRLCFERPASFGRGMEEWKKVMSLLLIGAYYCLDRFVFESIHNKLSY